jgi:rubrerythrin
MIILRERIVCVLRRKARESVYIILWKEGDMNALEVAKKMEIDSIKFYTEAAAKTNNPVGRKMFETVIEDEQRHLEMVIQMIKGMHFTGKDVGPMKRVKTVFERLKDHMMKKVEASKDDMEAFKIAMQIEKEGEAFYQESLTAAKTDKEKTLFQRLIEEERQHYAIFSNTYFHLTNTGSWFMWEERSIVEG